MIEGWVRQDAAGAVGVAVSGLVGLGTAGACLGFWVCSLCTKPGEGSPGWVGPSTLSLGRDTVQRLPGSHTAGAPWGWGPLLTLCPVCPQGPLHNCGLHSKQ